MPRVTYLLPDGSARTCDLAEGASVMDGALDNAIPGIQAQCGGASLCATCHCYLAVDWRSRVPAPEPWESEMLAYVWEPRPGSRLACQLRLSAALDGLTVEIPARQA